MQTDSLATNPSHARARTTPVVTLTEAFCAKAGPGEYQDQDCPALRFYVGPTGAKTFGGYKWSPTDKKALRKSFGTWTPT